MTGTGKLIRLILRRDRFLMPIWVVILGILPAAYISSFEGLFTTDADRIQYAQVSADNAGFVALYGLLHGDSFAVLANWRAGFVPVMIGLFALLTVIRHTRTDEEAGRSELIGATVVGRHAQLAAALITTAAACVVLGLITFAGMAGQQGSSTAGSLAFGAEFAVSGWIFAGRRGDHRPADQQRPRGPVDRDRGTRRRVRAAGRRRHLGPRRRRRLLAHLGLAARLGHPDLPVRGSELVAGRAGGAVRGRRGGRGCLPARPARPGGRPVRGTARPGHGGAVACVARWLWPGGCTAAC